MPRATSQLAMGPLVLLFYIQPQQVTLPGSHLSLKGTTVDHQELHLRMTSQHAHNK